jgi:hypothetical protein
MWGSARAEESKLNRFNNGKPYHGSREVTHGKLQGSTAETDYFYFFCPKCPDKHMLRILDYEVRAESADHPYKDLVKRKAKRAFTLALHVHCEQCLFTDFVKLSNTGWQGGTLEQALSR